MPNGFYGPPEEWDQLEAPFLLLDGELEKFAAIHELTLTKDYHNWPGRRIDWGAGIKRSILLVQITGHAPLYSISIFAAEDRGSKRYSKHATIVDRAPFDQIRGNLPQLLERARSETDSWEQDDLEISTPLEKMTPAGFIASQVGSWVGVVLIYCGVGAVILYLLFRIVSCSAA